MPFLTIVAAVVLILHGMRHLRKGVDRLLGQRLATWMEAATANRFKAFLGGIALGAAVPSSTSVAMLSVRMMHAATLSALPMVAVLLGANVGITVTVQLLSFRIDQLAFALLASGGVAFLFTQRRILRGGGQILLGLGIIFLAMRVMGEASGELVASPDVAELFAALGRFPIPVAVGTALLAVILQSSTASIALGIGLSQAGLLGADALLAWVVGTNLGTSLTLCLAGWNCPEGRRLAVAVMIPRLTIMVATLWAGGPATAALVEWYGAASGRLAADLHTGLNLIAGLIGLALLRPSVRAANWVLGPATQPSEERPRIHFSRSLLQSPQIALHHAGREMLPLFDDLRVMLKTVRRVGLEGKPEDFTAIDALQAGLIESREALGEYLARIDTESLNTSDAVWKTHLIDYSHDIVAVGAVIRRDLTDAALCLTDSDPSSVPNTTRAALEDLFRTTSLRIEEATLLLSTRDEAGAARFLRRKGEFTARCRALQRQWLREFTQTGTAPPFLPHLIDHLNCLRRIHSHIAAIAHLLLPSAEKADSQESG